MPGTGSRGSLGAGCSWVRLLTLAAFATMHNAGSAPVGVGSFPELNLAVGYGASSDEITAPDIVVDHQLEVRRTRTTDMLIASTIGATLSGGN